MEQMEIGAPAAGAAPWADRLSSSRKVALVALCVVPMGLVVSGLQNPLAELLWEAESGPAIGTPVQSLGQNAAARPRSDQSGLPDGGAQQVLPPTAALLPAAAARPVPHQPPASTTTATNGVPTSCAELFLQNPGLPDGSYTIQTAFGAEEMPCRQDWAELAPPPPPPPTKGAPGEGPPPRSAAVTYDKLFDASYPVKAEPIADGIPCVDLATAGLGARAIALSCATVCAEMEDCRFFWILETGASRTPPLHSVGW